jgi:hypothetical protein
MNLQADLVQRASVIADALKTAFGGASQVPLSALACAVAGQVNNNGLGCHGTLEEVCRAVVAAFDGDDDRTDLAAVIAACRSELDRLHVRHTDLPYPVA